MTIINADDPSLTPKKRAGRLWEKTSIRKASIECWADSVFLLADLWTAAWKEGGGNSISQSKLVGFEEKDLEDIYRGEANFVPSLSLGA
jgi:hypothetical protein